MERGKSERSYRYVFRMSISSELKGLEKWKVKNIESSDNYIDIFFICSSLRNVPNTNI